MPKNKRKAPHSRHVIGNHTMINPREEVQSLYRTNAITQVECHIDGVPITPYDDMEYAKYFVDENKK